MGIGVRFRAKDVRGPEPRANYWDRDSPFHLPRPYRAIEWFEIDLVEETRPEFTQSLLPLLQARTRQGNTLMNLRQHERHAETKTEAKVWYRQC